jgi:hypothetical protein
MEKGLKIEFKLVHIILPLQFYNISIDLFKHIPHPLQFQNYANFMEFNKMAIITNICPNPWYGIFSYPILG